MRRRTIMMQTVNKKADVCPNYVRKPKYTNIRQYLSNTKVVDCDFCEEPDYDECFIVIDCCMN